VIKIADIIQYKGRLYFVINDNDGWSFHCVHHINTKNRIDLGLYTDIFVEEEQCIK
jgi:hypothetical protein